MLTSQDIVDISAEYSQYIPDLISDAVLSASKNINQSRLDQSNIKETSLSEYITSVGNKTVKETAKILDKYYNIYYFVKSMEGVQDVIMLYLLCLISKENIDVPYKVNFTFERKKDKEYFDFKTSRIAEPILYKKLPLKEINSKLT
jgi:hypothetical protein